MNVAVYTTLAPFSSPLPTDVNVTVEVSLLSATSNFVELFTAVKSS